MAKTVQNVKNSLKFKVGSKKGILSVKVGIRKFTIPMEARMLSNEKYLFLSFPASSELYKVDGKTLEAMAGDADGSEAFQELNPKGKRGRRRRDAAQMPTDLAQALKGIPAGYRVGYDETGAPKLVRKRARRKSKA